MQSIEIINRNNAEYIKRHGHHWSEPEPVKYTKEHRTAEMQKFLDTFLPRVNRG